jgi:cytochrome P450
MPTEIPGATGLPFLGEILAFRKDPFAFTLERTRRHGPVWKTKILGDEVVFFAGPEAFSFFLDPDHFTREKGSPPHVRALLGEDAVPFLDGPRHFRRKRLLLAAFTERALASYLPVLARIIARYVDRWAGQERPIGGELRQLSFDVANALFAGADPDHSDLGRAADFDAMIAGLFAPPIKLPFTTYGKALRARDRLRAYLGQAIAERSGAGTVLGVLKAVRDDEGVGLTATELEVELLHFFSAAHAGLAGALAWMTVAMAQAPKVSKLLREELTSPGAPGAVLRPITSAFCREVLRAYPIAPNTFFGVARRELRYGDLIIPRGRKAAGAIWATLQDGGTFEMPSTFLAGRLAASGLERLPAAAYVPQGGGPATGHRCPGESLVALVMPLYARLLLARCELALPPQDLSYGPGGLGPLPASGLVLAARRRPELRLVAGGGGEAARAAMAAAAAG